MLADGRVPMLPVKTAPMSLRMSPKVFSVRMTSNCAGRSTICIAQLSTYWWFSSTSEKTRCVSVTTWRQSRLTSRTLALSTEVTFFLRSRASAKALRAMRSISRR